MKHPSIIGESASATAAAIARRAISAQEVVDQHLQWMARVNPSLNAVTVDLSAAAHVAAERADAQLRSGAPIGPLHGVPVRPTIGRVPAFNSSQLAERPYLMQMMSVQGPMGRSVADVRLALTVMARRDPRDPLWVPAPLEGPALEQPVRIALLRESFGLTVDADVDAALRQAAHILREAGYTVEETAPPCDMRRLLQLWFSIIFTEMRVLQEPAMRRVASADVNVLMDAYLEIGGVLDLEAYLRALCIRRSVCTYRTSSTSKSRRSCGGWCRRRWSR